MNKRFLQVALSLVTCLLGGCNGVFSAPTSEPVPTMPPPTATPEPVKPLVVSYVKNGDVWVWVWDQQLSIHRRLTCDGSAQEVKISSDALAIAYRTTLGELKAVKLDGIDISALDPNVVDLCAVVKHVILINSEYLMGLNVHGGSSAAIRSFEFAGNTHNLYFNVDVVGVAGGVDLFAVSIENLLPVRLVAPGQGGNFHLSPSGQWLVVTIPNQLILSRANGDNAKIIFTFPPICAFGSHEGPEVVWRSDSSGFYVVTPKIIEGELYGYSILYYVDTYGTATKQIELLALPHSETHISPRGTYVVNMIDYGDLIDLHIIEPGSKTDSEYISYPKDELDLVAWSPDELGFVYWLGKLENRKFYYGRQGTPPFLVKMDYVVYSLPGGIIPFEWADNESFVFIGVINGQKHLVLYSLAGNVNTPLLIDMVDSSFDIPNK